MTIRVRCECGKNLNAPDEYAGKRAKCPACGRQLTVPVSPTPAYDVFISHSHHDKAVADAMCAAMEARRLRCWIAPRDILPGKEWSEAIIEGIDACRIMVLIFSSNSDSSRQVRREVERAVSKGSIVIPFRVENVPMSKAMEYFLSSAHWLDAMTDPLDQHLKKLADTVRTLLHRPEVPVAAQGSKPASTSPSDLAKALAAENLRLVFDDDFRSGLLDWGQNTGAVVARSEPSGYLLELTPQAGPAASVKVTQESVILTPPFAFEIAVAKDSGPDANGFGVALVDANSSAPPDGRACWSFEITGSGHATCLEWRNGDVVSPTATPVPFFLSSHLALGNHVNRIAVVCRAEGFSVYANGAWLCECPATNLPSAYKLALRSGGGLKLRYQHLRLYRKSLTSLAPDVDGGDAAEGSPSAWKQTLIARGFRLQLEDDFRGGRLNWPQQLQPFILQNVNGGYRLENLSDGSLQVRQDAVVLNRPLAVEVDVTKIAGDDTLGFGLSLIDAASDAFWGFQIGGTGHAAVFEWKNGDGNPTSAPVPFFLTSHVKRGNATNRLGVILAQDGYSYYVNGKWACDGRIERLPSTFKFAIRGGRLHLVYNRLRLYQHGPAGA